LKELDVMAAGGPKVESTLDLNETTLSNFKMKLQPQKSFTKVWDSRGCGVRNQASIWAPNLEISKSSVTKRNKVRVCLGYYHNDGFNAPKRTRSINA